MSKFKVYHFRFAGLWMGGQILIVATSKEKAEKIARERVDDLGFKDDKIELVSEYDVVEGIIVYEYNGDY